MYLLATIVRARQRVGSLGGVVYTRKNMKTIEDRQKYTCSQQAREANFIMLICQSVMFLGIVGTTYVYLFVVC